MIKGEQKNTSLTKRSLFELTSANKIGTLSMVKL